MPAKKKPLPLHVSLARINAERANVVIRTKNWIALLHATSQNTRYEAETIDVEIVPVQVHVQSHCCINTFCFCVLLVVMNLLLLQGLYYKVQNLKQM
jgi:hypothetical protein